MKLPGQLSNRRVKQFFAVVFSGPCTPPFTSAQTSKLYPQTQRKERKGESKVASHCEKCVGKGGDGTRKRRHHKTVGLSVYSVEGVIKGFICVLSLSFSLCVAGTMCFCYQLTGKREKGPNKTTEKKLLNISLQHYSMYSTTLTLFNYIWQEITYARHSGELCIIRNIWDTVKNLLQIQQLNHFFNDLNLAYILEINFRQGTYIVQCTFWLQNSKRTFLSMFPYSVGGDPIWHYIQICFRHVDSRRRESSASAI